jgi:TPR repeat protein
MIISRQVRLSVECAACVLVTGVLCTSAFASPSEDSCHEAYWDGTKLQDLARCKASAESGDAGTEFLYGLILWSGHDRASDHKTALDWFRKSARQGHGLARISLGGFLSHPEIEQSLRNVPEAYAWYSVAGARESAAKLRSQMNGRELEQAKRLVKEFREKYGETTGITK